MQADHEEYIRVKLEQPGLSSKGVFLYKVKDRNGQVWFQSADNVGKAVERYMFKHLQDLYENDDISITSAWLSLSGYAPRDGNLLEHKQGSF